MRSTGNLRVSVGNSSYTDPEQTLSTSTITAGSTQDILLSRPRGGSNYYVMVTAVSGTASYTLAMSDGSLSGTRWSAITACAPKVYSPLLVRSAGMSRLDVDWRVDRRCGRGGVCHDDVGLLPLPLLLLPSGTAFYSFASLLALFALLCWY